MWEKKNFIQAIDLPSLVWYNGGMETKVNKNSKSILSRLLATENIFVIHDNKASTASFDIMNRVLRLPVFKEMSEELYDMLVGHEVSHALYTPFTEEDRKSLKDHGFLSCAMTIADGDKDMARLAHGYMNVVEDARIERLIKEKFAGIRRDFFIGYKQLHEKDFFGINGTDISTMPFIDRINLYFKIGSHVQISFTDEEMEFVNMVENTRSFDDVIEVTKKIWQYCKDKKRQSQSDDLMAEFKQDSESDAPSNGMGGKEQSDKTNKGDQWTTRAIKPEECSTQQNFEENLKDLRNEFTHEVQYHSLPKFNENNGVVKYKKLLAMFDTCASAHSSAYEAMYAESRKFIDESNRVVNILAQEFLSKKAARDHHRNSTSRTGMIDTVRMMNHKVSDDIFLRMKVVPKGKSHGLVFYTDLSGSMSPVLEDTFKQLIQLVLFCKRVNIPYEVYGFTTRRLDGEEMDSHEIERYQEWAKNTWTEEKTPYVNENLSVYPFTLVNLFSSKMKKTELDAAIRNVFAVSAYFNRKTVMFSIPTIMQLSSTPLIESIIAAMDMVPKFKQDNKLDIVHTVFLTDGEATGVAIYNNSTCYKNSHLFKLNQKFNTESNMIKIFRDVTGSKAIAFFICDQKTSAPYHVINGWSRNVEDAESYEKKNKQYMKEGWTTASNTCHLYDEKFIIRGNSAVEYGDLDEILADKSSNVGIRNGFIKAMNQNLVSRVMLNRFIQLIATE
jgi:hypothetical protein